MGITGYRQKLRQICNLDRQIRAPGADPLIRRGMQTVVFAPILAHLLRKKVGQNAWARKPRGVCPGAQAPGGDSKILRESCPFCRDNLNGLEIGRNVVSHTPRV